MWARVAGSRGRELVGLLCIVLPFHTAEVKGRGTVFPEDTKHSLVTAALFRVGQHFFRIVIRLRTEAARFADSMRRMAFDRARGLSGFIRRRLTQTVPGGTYWPPWT